jgi:hypothetical protein
MRLQVLYHLPLGLCDETQRGSISAQAGERTDRKGTGVPERIK